MQFCCQSENHRRFGNFQPLPLDIKTTHSTWLDCSRLMSDFCCRSREFIKAYFCHKTHRFLPLSVLGKELQDFIAEQETDITEFDEALVKKLIEKITVFSDHFTVEFKSGITIDIEA